MNWITLLQAFRYGDQNARNLNEIQNRSIFEQDYDRIIFSTPFRRLQDKTQVIPLPEHDFVHNRLTHSIEVVLVALWVKWLDKPCSKNIQIYLNT